MKLQQMRFFVKLAVVSTLGGVAAGQLVPLSQLPAPRLVPSTSALATLPAAPGGKATVIGGEISNVDSVRDQFLLKAYGGKSMKILFDERTQFYRDQARVSVLDLHANDHALVETTLDGTKVFALRILISSQSPEGEVQGQVSSYDAHSGQLAVMGAITKQNVTVHVPAGMHVLLVGQQASSVRPNGSIDLVRGSIVNVKFRAVSGGRGEATHVDVLAVPGSAFTFSGNLSSLDVQAGLLVIVDPRDSQRHEVVYSPSQFPVSRDLQVGSYVKVTTSFDGLQYRASEIAVE